MAVAQAVGFSNDQTSSTITIPLSATGAGNSLIVMFANYISTKHGTSLVAGSGTSSAADFTDTDSNDNFLLSYWSLLGIAGGLTSAVLHMSTSAFVAGILIEESGLATSSAFDQSQFNYQTGAVIWTSNNTPTTTQASEIAYGMAMVPAVVTGASYGTLGSGWSIFTGSGLTAGVSSETTAGVSVLGIRQVLTSTGAYAANGGVGNTATNDSYAVTVGTYKTGSAGTAITPSTGAVALAGAAPSMNLGITPRTARKAWEYTKGLLVPSRKIFLPPRPALSWEG